MTLIVDHFRDSIKHVITLPEIQNVREASHNLTLMDNCETFYSNTFGFVLLLWLNSKMLGKCFTS